MKYLGLNEDEKSIVIKKDLQDYITNVNLNNNNIQIVKNGDIITVGTIPIIAGKSKNSVVGGGISPTIANGEGSLSFGSEGNYYSLAAGYGAVAFNLGQAIGGSSFAMGRHWNGDTQNPNSTATASGTASFAFGPSTLASGNQSIAFGQGSQASAVFSRAIGNQAQAQGSNSTACGQKTLSSGILSTALGDSTIASGRNQVVIGGYNIEDTDDGTNYTQYGSGAKKYAFIIGNGNSNTRSNAFTVDWDGNIEANNIITKESLDNAGIVSKTYTTLFNGSFTVTTEQTEQYDSPYALASVKGRLPQNYLYRVTFDGVQYILPVSLIAYPINEALKVCEYIGKLSLRSQEDAEGQTHVDPDVSFLILFDRDNNSSIEIFTEVAGEHTFSIERVEFTGTMFSRFLMYGGQYFPIEFIVSTSTYTGVSIGANKLLKYREAIAIGNGNTIDGEFSHAIGTGNMLGNGADDAIGRNNIITGRGAIAIGSNNSITGEMAHVFGTRNIASSQHGYAFGRYNDVSGVMSEALGYKNTVSGKFATAIGNGSLANHLSQYAIGSYNEADPSEAAVDERGNYLEIVGNGTDAENRSNARTLDWNGNESLAGSITLGKGTVDEVTLTAAQLKQLKQLINA